MTDLFVSYKAEDRPRVAPLVEALQADGYSVWWDAEIGGGEQWREEIVRHLDAAKLVVVVWSKRSVGPHGNFVRDEATRALRRHVYLPVNIDRVEPPLGFGETQSLNLIGWKGARADRKYQSLLAALGSRFAKPAASSQPLPADRGVDRRTVVARGAVLTAAAGAGFWALLRPSAAKADSIAVLPFANLSGDPTQAYFSDGIAEELRSALSRIAGLKVVGRTSSEAVRDEDSKIAARKLSVANVLTGSVRRSPAVIRVSAQLVDGTNGMERWSEIYDRAPGDALGIQSDIASQVAQALKLNLGQAGAPRRQGGTSNAAAQDLYLKALANRRQNPNENLFRQSLGLFDAAITLDPKFADAYAQKAITLTDLTGFFANSVDEFAAGYTEGAAIARQAISLAPDGAIGHAALAEALAGMIDFPGADAEYGKAAAVAGSNPEVLISYGLFLSHTGRPTRGLRVVDRVLELDPLNPRAQTARGVTLSAMQRYRDAIPSFQRAIELSKVPPDSVRVRIGECHMFLGDPARAKGFFAEVPADNPYRLLAEGALFFRMGDAAGSDRSLGKLRELYGDSALYQQAAVLAQQGKTEAALDALDRSLEVRDPGLVSLTSDKYLEPLHSETRFKALSARLGFPLR